jgi:hypothetical protein
MAGIFLPWLERDIFELIIGGAEIQRQVGSSAIIYF